MNYPTFWYFIRKSSFGFYNIFDWFSLGYVAKHWDSDCYCCPNFSNRLPSIVRRRARSSFVSMCSFYWIMIKKLWLESLKSIIGASSFWIWMLRLCIHWKPSQDKLFSSSHERRMSLQKLECLNRMEVLWTKCRMLGNRQCWGYDHHDIFHPTIVLLCDGIHGVNMDWKCSAMSHCCRLSHYYHVWCTSTCPMNLHGMRR